MAQKCVHKGCEKLFTDPGEECTYHPGPPVFHEGQKGWKCCKPRVLTFEEFMTISPCTTGKHSTTDLPPPIEEKKPESTAAESAAAALAARIDELATSAPPPGRTPIVPTAAPTGSAAQQAPESEDDDPALEIPDGKTCRRRGCGATYRRGKAREGEECLHHPGAPIFHEGSKGYLCCKRRVLEFDQFMKLDGCTTKSRHLFVGKGKGKGEDGAGGAAGGAGAGPGSAVGAEGGDDILETVRHDFYQTANTVNVSFFLKKIVRDRSTVELRRSEIVLDLVTSDARPKRFADTVPLFGPIDPAESTYKVLGTKLEVVLAKADGAAWPVLRADQAATGEILQVGRPALM